MINPKKLIEMARKRISIASSNAGMDTHRSVADKGHFVVYTADKRRFVVPLACLDNDIFRELLRMSEEEFGLPSDGPITLPCDAVFMEYMVLLIQRRVSENLEKALLVSIASGDRCSSYASLQLGQSNQRLLLHGF